MKILKQLAILLSLSLLGTILNQVIPLPIPAGIYGFLLLSIGLQTKLIQLQHLQETSDFLLTIMPLLFVPASVALMTMTDQIIPLILPLGVVIALTTIIVMIITGKVSDVIIMKDEQ